MTYIQYVEIYNETVFDLLAKERTQVDIRDDAVRKYTWLFIIILNPFDIFSINKCHCIMFYTYSFFSYRDIHIYIYI